MKEAILEDESGNQKKCTLEEKSEVKSCSVIVDKGGKYEAYATGSNGVTSAKEEITILIDKTAPTFDIENRGVNDKIEIEATSGLTANITNRVKNINDSESGIKTVEYSLEKRSDKVYYRSVKVATSFDINQTKEIEKYNLIVRVENNAGLKTEKTINYELYKKFQHQQQKVIVNKE